MIVEGNKALIRRLFEEVLNGGKMDVLDEVFSAEYVELPGQEGSGPERVKQRLGVIREAFPDLRWDLIADEVMAVARWRMGVIAIHRAAWKSGSPKPAPDDR